ncbi:PKc-like superfamily domain-containing protein [Histoplasma capsulatum var. duboisii H88]|nr:PKc-like superfamily domain-containing protein [Histoplasma capsulatum var. duboisii H88]
MIVSDLLADMCEKWVRDTSLKEDSCYFSLHHPDISVNNIFIDEEYNITCLIDWAFCSSVPLSSAITEPGLPQSRHELPEVFREEFRRGFSEAAYSTSNRADPAENALLCRILQLSHPMWLISRLLSFDTVVDYPVLNDLWVITNPNKGHLLEEFKIRQSQDTYMGVHALLKEDDDHSRAAEEKHFKKGTQVDLTVARKLTLVSQWSSRYGQHGFVGLRVASSAFKTGEALWKWIDRCMIDLQEMYG